MSKEKSVQTGQAAPEDPAATPRVEDLGDGGASALKMKRRIDGGAVVETGRRNVARYMDGVGLIIDENGERIR